MKYFTSILINILLSAFIGLVVLLAGGLLVRNADISYGIFLSVFGFINALIGSLIHVFIYMPFLMFKNFTPENNSQEEYLRLFFPVITAIFGVAFFTYFSLVLDSGRTEEAVLVGIFCIYIAQSISAVFLANRLKNNYEILENNN